MKDVIIETIRSDEQVYPTCGNYQDFDKYELVSITKQDNEDYEFLVAIHELVEWWITKKRGIKEEDITSYDVAWELRSSPKADEPGNEEDCPYKKEHRFAENIERQIAHELGIDWEEYNKKLKI